jgi:hypothetical protein
LSIYEIFKEQKIIISKEKYSDKISKREGNHKQLEESINGDLVSLSRWKKLRMEMGLSEWIDFLLTSIGYDPEKLLFYEKIYVLIRLLPFCVNGYHIIDVGPKSTGKSYTYGGLSDNSVVYCGKITVPALFRDKRVGGELGVINLHDVVAFDEMSESDKIEGDLVTSLRGFMANKSSGRDGEDLSSDASLVFLGNTTDEDERLLLEGTYETLDLLQCFPDEFRKEPFKDRIAFFVPSWRMRRDNREQFFPQGEGVNVHYLFSILKELKNEDINVKRKKIQTESSRGAALVKLSVAGLIKLLYPHKEYSNWEQEALFNIALFGRKLLKDQSDAIDITEEYLNFIIKANLKMFKSYGIDNIEEAYYHMDRLIIKPVGQDKVYKIALDSSGVKLNESEFNYYTNLKEKNDHRKKYILPIYKINSDFQVIIQDYEKPKGNRNSIKLKDFQFKPLDFESISDTEVRDVFKQYVVRQDAELLNIKTEISQLKSEIMNKNNESNKLKSILEETFRSIKLEMLEMKIWIEGSNKINFVEGKTDFVKLLHDESLDIKNVKKLLGIDNLKTSDYHLDKEEGIKIINFGHLISKG